jgi:hypothetical protein
MFNGIVVRDFLLGRITLFNVFGFDFHESLLSSTSSYWSPVGVV